MATVETTITLSIPEKADLAEVERLVSQAVQVAGRELLGRACQAIEEQPDPFAKMMPLPPLRTQAGFNIEVAARRRGDGRGAKGWALRRPLSCCRPRERRHPWCPAAPRAAPRKTLLRFGACCTRPASVRARAWTYTSVAACPLNGKNPCPKVLAEHLAMVLWATETCTPRNGNRGNLIIPRAKPVCNSKLRCRKPSTRPTLGSRHPVRLFQTFLVQCRWLGLHRMQIRLESAYYCGRLSEGLAADYLSLLESTLTQGESASADEFCKRDTLALAT